MPPEAFAKYGFTSRISRTTPGAPPRAQSVEGDTVDLAVLKAADLIKDDVLRARVFLSGEIGKAVNVKGLKVTKGAREAIVAAGGSVERSMANGMPSMNNAGMGELFRRLRLFLLLVIYRIGIIPVPGIDPAQLSALFDQNRDHLGLAKSSLAAHSSA